jgi:hypothetical protein
MSRLLPLLLLLVLVLSFGCKQERGQFAMYHPNKTFSRWDEDLKHCRSTVMALRDSGRLEFDSTDAGVQHCMEAKGYVYGFRPFPEPTQAFGGENGEFVILESTWHSRELAENRAEYLKRTGIWNVTIQRADFGEFGVWQQVVLGPHDSVREAREQADTLFRSHGLGELLVIRKTRQ